VVGIQTVVSNVGSYEAEEVTRISNILVNGFSCSPSNHKLLFSPSFLGIGSVKDNALSSRHFGRSFRTYRTYVRPSSPPSPHPIAGQTDIWTYGQSDRETKGRTGGWTALFFQPNSLLLERFAKPGSGQVRWGQTGSD
jgi:hypothetical protein